MSSKNHDWSYEDPPIISRHTLHKHQLYEDYISRYIDTVKPHLGEVLKFSIVDGFCGGGIYDFQEKGETCYGSPVRIIEAVRKKAAEINKDRNKPIKFLVNYYFIDNDEKAISCLHQVFAERDIVQREGEIISIQKGNFVDLYPKVRESIKGNISGKTAKHKAIFILDQYAYKDVPLTVTNQIMSDFLKAEVLLTFFPRAFMDYAGKNNERSLNTTNRQLQRLGFNVSIEDIRAKAYEMSGVESYLHKEQFFLQEAIASVIKEVSHAKHFSKYFIQSANSSRDLWIIHLANHYKAHDVMISVQWDSSNCDYYHPGYLGLPPALLGFDSDQSDLTQQLNFDMTHFNSTGETRTIELISEQLPKMLFDSREKSIAINALFQDITNDTTCNMELLKRALQVSLDRKDIRLVSKNTSSHRVATAAPDDALIETVQRPLILI